MIRGFGAGIPLLNAMKGVTSAVRSWWNLPRWLDVYWKEMMWESRESPFKKIDDWCLVRRIMLESVHVSFLVSEIETSAANHETGRIGRLNFFRSFQLNIWAKMRMLENSHHVPSLPHPSKNISNQVTLDSLPSKSIISSSRKTSFTRSPFRKFSWHHQHPLTHVYRSSMWKPDGLTKPQIRFPVFLSFCLKANLMDCVEIEGFCWYHLWMLDICLRKFWYARRLVIQLQPGSCISSFRTKVCQPGYSFAAF